jgi:hypothetical protein
VATTASTGSSGVRPRRVCLYGWLLLVALVAWTTAAAVSTHAAFQATSGLRGVYESGPERLAAVEPRLSPDRLRRLTRVFDARPWRAAWHGYLIVPATASYRFALGSDGEASLVIGRRLVADSRTPLGATVTLTRGLHPLDLQYETAGHAPHLTLRWARGDGALHEIPPLLLVPELRDHDEVRRRRLAVTGATLLPLVLLLAVAVPPMAAFWWVAWRSAIREHGRGAGAPLWLLGGCTALFASGAWWGVPAHGSWAPDEVTPGDVLTAIDARFAGGWATIYPPLHYAVLALVYLPHRVAAALGLIELPALQTVAQLTVLGRLVSVAMGTGLVALVYHIGREHFGARAGLYAAAISAVALPLTYYAKTANLDVPYVFWLTMSLVFYTRIGSRGAPKDFYLFTLAGVAAICTKDQAYGFYVLPAIWMAAGALICRRRPSPPPGVPGVGVLARMTGLAILAFVVFWNLPVNLEGFREHVRLITGPASEGFRMEPNSPGGHVRLLAAALVQVAQAMTWPLAGVAAWAAVSAVATRHALVSWLLVPAVSYYVCFIGVVGYHYDRFFLGIIPIGAIAAGWWLQTWSAPGASARRWRLAAVAAALVYGASRGVALDVLMIQDARYAAERTLREHVAPADRVGAAGMSIYLPRPERHPWHAIEEDPGVLRQGPEYILVNAGYALRFTPDSRRGQFYEALGSGEAGYRRLARFETTLRLSPLALERRFRQLREDEYSNLPKVSPTIDVYVRD